MINYNGRNFVSIEITENGEVSSQTFFEYKQDRHISLHRTVEEKLYKGR
jgi:hypothetical protein